MPNDEKVFKGQGKECKVAFQTREIKVCYGCKAWNHLYLGSIFYDWNYASFKNLERR